MSTREDPTVGSARTATDRPDARIPETPEKNAAEKAAGPVGGAAGALAGGTAGTLVAGPIGTAIGAIAGAVGGWWAGHGVEREAEMSSEDEHYYRTHYEAGAPTGADWQRARPAYQLGHLAARNPAYRARSFNDIEPDLRHGWSGETAERHGSWESIRDLARAAYERWQPSGQMDRDVTQRHIGGEGQPRQADAQR